MNIASQTGVSNYVNVGETDVGRVMPTVGFEYRYPLSLKYLAERLSA